jgi:hypothetical protein
MIQRFLCACSGAYVPLLWKEEYAFERSRYAGIGTAIFLVSLTAVASFSFAVNLAVRDPKVALAAGILFGALIFNLDRMLVITLRKPKKGYTPRQYGLVVLRLAVSGLLGLVVTTPLVLRVFEPELKRHHSRRVAAEAPAIELAVAAAYPRIQVLRSENDSLAQVEQEKHSEVMRYEQRAKDEGNGVFGMEGPGWRYAQDTATMHRLQEQAERQRSEHDLLRQRNTAELDSLVREQHAYRDSLLSAESGSNGLAAHLQAMHELQVENPAVWWAHWLLVAALMALEISPVLLKLSMPRGPLEAEIERMEMTRISRSDANAATAERSSEDWATMEQGATHHETQLEGNYRHAQQEANQRVRLDALDQFSAHKQRTYVEVLNRAVNSPVLGTAKLALTDEIAVRMATQLRGMVDSMFTSASATDDEVMQEIKRSATLTLMEEVEHAGRARAAGNQFRSEIE